MKILLILMLLLFPFNVFGEELNLAENAESAILIEASTGKILYQKNSYEMLKPASMTKMMSLILIMEQIDNGNLKWDDSVVVSQNASSMGGSQIFLEENEVMSVEDLVKGICIASGNDATVALAERIAGTEEAFVKLMNDKAEELGLKNTHFANSTGLDSDNHYSSAYDMALIAKELIKHDKILEYSSIYEDYLRVGTDNSFWLVNTNKLVRFYSYIDGLKTGYTNGAGYCLTATGKKNGMRLISVVMNEDNTDNRTTDTIAMMNYGFNMYSLDRIVSTSDVLGNIKISLGVTEEENIRSVKEINILNNQQEGKKNITYDIVVNNVIAPVKVGDIVGKLNLYEDGKYMYSVNLTVMNDVKKVNILVAFLRNIKDVVTVGI